MNFIRDVNLILVIQLELQGLSDVTTGSLMNCGTEVTAVLGLGYKHNHLVLELLITGQFKYDSETTAYGNGFRITRYNPNMFHGSIVSTWRYHIWKVRPR